MKISLLIALVMTIACTEAPKNLDSRNKNPNDRNTRNNPAATGDLYQLLHSHISRSREKKQLSYKKVRDLIKADDLDKKHYRIIPVPERDNTAELIEADKPLKPCGIDKSLSSIKARINSCITANGDRNIWKAEDSGVAGEVDWRLVANSTEQDEFSIWQDTKTELLWSHTIGNANWNQASGSDVKAGDFLCGNLDIFPPGQVTWRLPTRNEFLQADIDGAKAVTYFVEDGDLFWTATTDYEFDKAWSIYLKTGVLSSVGKDQELDVKCVGEIIK